ncbi:unnamed protein product [Blepharisma stoltei]|uniref:TNFR-Cys domain-containing protein n=1 Tax=Blepharisma stoltei TaxID=1481888 RepID=A0AAU9KAX4_9CILI|nr:unnamed protein product [Blepharisma stoltei]
MILALFYFSKIVLTFVAATCPYNSVTIGCANSKYFIDTKVCADVCPSLFTPAISNGYDCCNAPTYANAVIFELEFSTIKDVTATYIASSTDPSEYFLNPSSIPYNSPTQNSPLPTIDRGFYFAKTSSITSNKSHIPGLYFTLNIWIKPLETGEILNVILSSNSYIRIWIDSGFFKFSALIYDSNNTPITQTVATVYSINSSWHPASMIIYQATCNQANIFYYVDYASVGNTALMNRETRFPDGNYAWTIGNLSGGNSFRGFIYWLQARADYIQSSATITVTVNCIDNQFWNGSTCQNCNSNCQTWPWCIRSSDCSICYLQDCAYCIGYAQSMCTGCATGMPTSCCDVYGSACTQTWTNTACNSGMILIGGVCLYACPYGFGNCAAVSSAVINADFTGGFVGTYGSILVTATSSASYNYWNSPESSDPFPAKNRGLYFNSNQFLSGNINLSNTWTMSMWVYPISGTLIGHSTDMLNIDSSGIISFYLEKWDGSAASYSATQSTTTNAWNYVSYSVGFANKITTVTPFLNKVAGTPKTVTNYVFRLPSGGKLYIGKGPTNFKGFIAYFILWQVTISDFTFYYNINSLTGGLVPTLWPCDYSHYYDGSACQSCLDSSCTNGCTRGTSCYICDDFLCARCSSFWAWACTLCIPNASGTPCSCNSGFYQPTNQALCSACYSGCTHCTGSYYHLCTSCISSYFLYNSKLCLPDCPTGYTKNTATASCDLSSLLPLSFSFNNKILLDQISGVQVGSSSANSYPTYDGAEPYPAYLRGYYFGPGTWLKPMLMLAPNFSISLWIKTIVSGSVITKYVTTVQWSLQISALGNPKLSILLMDSSSTISVTGSYSVIDSWFFVSFDGKINSDGTTTINSYIDTASQITSTTATPLFLLDNATGNMYIGMGFTGFLWKLNFYSQNNHALDDWQTVGCSGICTKCPADLSCPDNCLLSQYYDGSVCQNCINTCNKGCRNSDTCRLCKTKECATCIEFTGSSSCLTCITNAVSDGNGGCTCAPNAFWVSSTQTCEVCDTLCSTCLKTAYFECSACLGGYQLAGTVCLDECPYSTSCSAVTTAVIDQSFNADFQGSYGIFTTGTSAATFQFFNSPETVDPIPAYKRGLYFDGTMRLLSSVPIYISYSFSVGTWLYVITNGDLLQKHTLLTLSSAGSISATIVNPSQATSTQILVASSSFTGWAYLSITFQYSLGSTTLTIYINGISSSAVTATKKIFRDQAPTYLMLGKSNSSGFIGFLYYFQLWNTAIAGFTSIINNFSFCGSGQGASCLWTCDISSYNDGSSYLGCSSCSYGCRRGASCNICDDTLCLVCTGFGTNKCTQCVASAVLISGSCFCNANYGKSADGQSCIACFNGCSQCTDITYNKCTACNTGFYFYSNTGQCLTECPSGYTANSGTKTCDYLSYIGISLDLTDQIRLDTVSNFDVGSLNTNTYPDWSDNSDPVPSKQRGYYFANNDSLYSKVMLAPSFTISLWTKPLSGGILMAKWTSTVILLIGMDTSGFPICSAVLADWSTKTLTTPTSICNSWHFLSFTGQVQSDGKTSFNLYLNNVVKSTITTTTLTYFKDSNTGSAGKLAIGYDPSIGNNGLYGFLARVMIYNSYNYQSSDYATSSCATGCSACPSNHLCLSECDFDKYPDSCGACLTGCNKGCVSDLTCQLCRDKECYSCTTFSGECTSCITNSHKVNGHCTCLTNALWVSSSQSCELCDSICASCSNLKFNGCLTCASGYYLIQSLCMSFCPTGYIINGDNCDGDSTYTNFFVFNLMPHQIKDVVYDLESNIPVLTGQDSKFYPNYDSTDPIAAIYRGYYYTGSSFMQLPPYGSISSPLLTFSPKFVISSWIKPKLGTGVIFSKQASSGSFKKYVSLELINKAISLTLTLKDSTTITYTSANPSLEATLSQWNFISASSSINSTPQQIVALSKNLVSDTSSGLDASWLNDLENSSFITIGACHFDSTTYTSFFNGFLWDLKIYNTLITVSSLTSSTCSGCSLCPINNANSCLDNCDIDKYWNGNSCVSCLSGCSSKGCVRTDKNCNLCQDIICEICDDYTSTCITCKTHASLVGVSCQCDLGYFWDSANENCGLCDASCKTCTSTTYLDCLECSDGLYKMSGACLANCPAGFSPSGGVCMMVQEKIFDLDLNTLNGVIYDKASLIPVITGSSKQFYPNYEPDDPIPAYLRGFYFNGKSSILRMPEYSNYTSPRLVITSTFTISIWLNTETSYGTLFSKHNISDNYSTLYSISLMGSKVSISFTLSSFQTFYMADRLLNNYEWSHVVFTLELTQNGYTKLSCYINGFLDSPGITIYGTFQDQGPHTTFSIGAKLTASAIYNFYQGFLYQIQVYNIIKPISSLSTTSCTESCSVCPTTQICIPNCKINEYWSGPSYNACYKCNIKCKSSCRDWRSACSLCGDLLCDNCIDYSSIGCVSCKENAINHDSCICDINYVLDPSNNNTCIPVKDGGFRGSDGKLYSCPNLCTHCESLTKCNSCVENASLKNELCYCDLSYNGTKNCTLVTFSASLTVLSDNSLYLIFSESLANSLTVNDFTITIEKQGEASFKMENVNNTCYYISLNIVEAVSKGTLAILKFLNLTEVRSVSNGILNSSVMSVSLNSYDPQPYSPAIAAISSQATAAVQTAISGAVVMSVANPSPSSLWSMMNSLQILSYLTLSGIPFSSKMSTFLINLNSFNLFPNAFSYIIDKNEGNTPYSQAKEFGYDSDLILITTGNDFTLIMASLLILPIIWFFSQCSYRWLGKKFMKTIKAYQFAFYLRFWIQCYLELGAAASIGLATLGLNNITQITNFIICISICMLLIATPPLHFWFSYKNKNRIQSREKTFTALFSSLFYEFRIDRGLLATQYYFVFFIRRLIYIVNLVFLRDYPQTEVTINIVLSLMTIMHLIFCWPFEDPILQISNLLTEIMIWLVMVLTAAYLFNLEEEIVSTIENVIVGIVIGVMVIQAFASIAIFARTLYGIIYHKLAKAGIVKNSIKPLNNQIKNAQKSNL